MARFDDAGVQQLLQAPNHAVVSTINDDGSVHATVVWVDTEDGRLAVNSAVGRTWPSNLERDPRITVTVYDERNPYEYVEIRGRATPELEGADAHIDRLAKKYMDEDSYPFRREGEQRITFLVEPERVRYRKG
jgi:PPOX class probable F420-dependent enzyme